MGFVKPESVLCCVPLPGGAHLQGSDKWGRKPSGATKPQPGAPHFAWILAPEAQDPNVAELRDSAADGAPLQDELKGS